MFYLFSVIDLSDSILEVTIISTVMFYVFTVIGLSDFSRCDYNFYCDVLCNFNYWFK